MAKEFMFDKFPRPWKADENGYVKDATGRIIAIPAAYIPVMRLIVSAVNTYREPVYVYQDGAQFYMFEKPESKRGEGQPFHIWSWDKPVKDFDTPAARQARAAFVAWCNITGFDPIWEM